MSLRLRVLAALLSALVFSFGVGTGLAVWRAARSVRTELAASLENARNASAAALAALDGRADRQGDLRRVVAMSDGSRHVRAELLDGSGAVRAQSVLAVSPRPPRWFLSLATPVLPSASIAVVGAPPAAELRLVPDADNEAGERWQELRESVGLLGLFCVVAALLCSVTVSVSLRPLSALSQGLTRLGRGEAEPRLTAAGPPEIAALASAFNAMAAALHQADVRNARLQSQMAAIADEERSEIARDLHDEFGPLLFAIAAFAATIGRMVESGDAGAVPEQLRAIQDATAALRSQVRDMLVRLNEPDAGPMDLADSLDRLVAFWRSVQPGVSFELVPPPDTAGLPEAGREALFRAAQEAVSNAVRHGRPRSVRIGVAAQDGMAVLTVEDDGIGGAEGPGMGLPGMRARAAALGGRVRIARGAGWTVAVELPLAARTAEAPA